MVTVGEVGIDCTGSIVLEEGQLEGHGMVDIIDDGC